MAADVFPVPVFLVVFRESLETVISVSVLLAFLKQPLDGPHGDQAVYKKLIRQVLAPPHYKQANKGPNDWSLRRYGSAPASASSSASSSAPP